MTSDISAVHELSSRSLVVVTGKGGVGKTTVTAVLARAIAAAGRRVLALEVDPRESLHQMFEAPPSGGAEVAVGEGLTLLHLRPRAALDSLVERRLGSSWLAGRLTGNPAYEHFAEGAPGLRELAVFAWVAARLAGEISGVDGEAPDVVVLDAPASGHAAAWLEAPAQVAEATGRGPVADFAGELADRIADADRTGIAVVTLAEEMPVSETLELAERLHRLHSREPDLLLVNGLLPEWPEDGGEPDEEWERLWQQRRRLQQRERLRLLEHLAAAPEVALPLLAHEAGGALVDGLLEAIGRPRA